jgi:TrmH RNA methyltransferase
MKADTICGLNAVKALFARREEDVLRLFHNGAMRGVAGPYCARMAKSRRPYRMVEDAELAKIAATEHHGGIVAVAKPRVPRILSPEMLPRVPLLLVIDGVGNPHNLGAIARSAAFFGVQAMLLRELPGAAMPSDAAYRTAEGGMEHLELWRTRDLPGALGLLAPHYRCVATALTPDAMPLSALPRDRALAVIVGNEETGVSPEVLRACRRHVRIPGSGVVQSLNVAQAAAVLLHALS